MGTKLTNVSERPGNEFPQRSQMRNVIRRERERAATGTPGDANDRPVLTMIRMSFAGRARGRSRACAKPAEGMEAGRPPPVPVARADFVFAHAPLYPGSGF